MKLLVLEPATAQAQAVNHEDGGDEVCLVVVDAREFELFVNRAANERPLRGERG